MFAGIPVMRLTATFTFNVCSYHRLTHLNKIAALPEGGRRDDEFLSSFPLQASPIISDKLPLVLNTMRKWRKKAGSIS
jgi:hypothetical protein